MITMANMTQTHSMQAMEIESSQDLKARGRLRRTRMCRQASISMQMTIHRLCCSSLGSSLHRHADSNPIHKQVDLKTSSRLTSRERSTRTVWRPGMRRPTRTSSSLTCSIQPTRCLYRTLRRQQLPRTRRWSTTRVEGR